jgi:alcohol dehydrogenase class IV
VKEEQLRSLAEKAFGIKRILRVNPRTVTVEEIEGIFRDAL